ncbi:holo-ACP synthase [Kiloniella sp. b19]|uniref:holo-ACP synthase n=1 Tax=Kiloniella sp. GXU_MW_B19 TaxID=3141326 RepID=UPI0031E12BE1
MILGIGTDLVDIRRIAKSLERTGERFVGRIFTDEEQARAYESRDPAASYAKRFAAKEACAKAIGCGLWRDGVAFTDFSVGNHANGQPYLSIDGQGLNKLREKTPAGMKPVVHLSLSDDYPLAQAFVVISLEPEGAVVR